MNPTRSQLESIRAKFPHISADVLARNQPRIVTEDSHTRLCASVEKPSKARPRSVSGKSKVSELSAKRAHIVFHAYARRAEDWDNLTYKPMQDLLIKSGIIHGDDWHQLYGTVVSHKVQTEAEERTEIIIEIN